MVWEVALAFGLGLILGSFVKATADRLIKGKTIWGRSQCDRCKKRLHYYDLIPVLSYLYLCGQCRYCHKKIPRSNLLVELAMGLVTVGLFIHFLPNQFTNFNLQIENIFAILTLVFNLFLVTVLGVVFLVDLKIGLILDKVLIISTVISGLLLIAINSLKSYVFYINLKSSPISQYLLPPHSNYLYDQILRLWWPLLWGVSGGVVIAIALSLLIIITRGRGMGWGDVKYVLFLGLALGFPNVLIAVLLAFFLGAVSSLLLILLKRKHFGQTVPFGPFLSLGALISILWGKDIFNWYIHFSLGNY